MNLNNIKNNFKFFVPLDITKAKDSEGKEVMKIGGIASTIDKDTDGEVLDPNGFQLDYFLNNGFVNWHHQSKTNPNAVIGEPTKAEIRKEGLYIEAELYKDSKVAQQVWDLANVLEKNKSNRKLGFSIEGKVVERGCGPEYLDNNQTLKNPQYSDYLWKQVKKAVITGVAVTPSPKNSSTILDILKGNFIDDKEDFEIISSETLPNGGTIEYIIDICKPNGDRITVDKEYNVKLISKSLDTNSGKSLIKESLEGNLKNIENNFLGNKKNSNFELLKKSEIFFDVLNFTNDIEKAKQVTNTLFNNLNQEQMSKPESLEIIKALQELGVEITEDQLIKAEDKISKDEIEKANESENKKEVEKDKENLEKSSHKKDETENQDNDLEKAYKKAEEAMNIAKDKWEKSKISKSVSNDLQKEDINVDELRKSIITEFEEKQKNSFDSILSKLDEMSKANDSLNQKIENLENQSNGRKSLTGVKFLEKSFTEDELKSKKVLSLSKDKNKIGQILIAKSGIEKGESNDFYVNAALQLESGNTLSKSVITDLNINENIIITQ